MNGARYGEFAELRYTAYQLAMIPSEFVPLHALNSAEIAEVFNRCFEGYLVPVHVSAESIANRFRRDAVDLTRSFVMEVRGERAALAIVAPRFKAARLGGMGVAKEFRGQGVGRAVVAEFLRRLRDGGFEEACLEVFEQNTPAVNLYRAFGFEVVQRLFGFEREAFAVSSGVDLVEVSAERYIEALMEDSESAFPWIQGPFSIGTISLPARCFTVDGSAFALITPPEEGAPLFPVGMIVKKSERGKGRGAQLLAALQSLSPGSRWIMPQIFPESIAGFMDHLGFERMKLNQFEMRLSL